MSLAPFVRRLSSLTLLAALFAVGPAQAASVRSFSPQGEVESANRFVAQFSADMVALGQADAPAPFQVDCGAVPGEGRWSDGRSWAWTLQRPLSWGESCRFTLRADFRGLDGERVTGKAEYRARTAAPRVRALRPAAKGQAEEDQVFILNTGAALDPAVAKDSLWCEAAGVGSRIPAQLLSPDEAGQVLPALGLANQGHLSLLRCSERLPTGKAMKIAWDARLRLASGVAVAGPGAIDYQVRPAFHAEFSCERARSDAPCSPFAALGLSFSDPVDAARAQQIRLVTPEGSRAPAISSEGGQPDVVDFVSFPGPLPARATLRIELPADFRDASGRPLDNAKSFPLSVPTDDLPPLAKFPGRFGILELKEGGVLPLTLRGVEAELPVSTLQPGSTGAHQFASQRLEKEGEVLAAMQALEELESRSRTVTDKEGREWLDSYYPRELSFLRGRAGVASRKLPAGQNPRPFEVIGVPLEKPGFYVVEVESRLLGKALLMHPGPMYVRTTALVTNLAVHLKQGRDDSLVWVTSLDEGRPVAGAELRAFACDGELLWQGRSDDSGLARIEQALPLHDCPNGSYTLVSARLGGDFSFTRSDWTEGIEPWRFGVDTWVEDGGPRRIHSVLDRSLLRPGETVSMKHLARERFKDQFRVPAAAALPATLVIEHSESEERFELPLEWDARGNAVSRFPIPPSARLGLYRITMNNPEGDVQETGSFRVSDFRLPVFTGSLQAPGKLPAAPKEVPLQASLSFLNGGAARDFPVEVSAVLEPRWQNFPGYSDYNFAIGFDEEAEDAFALGRSHQESRVVLDKQALTLDRNGAGKVVVSLPERLKAPARLRAEMTFADPNGEIQTLSGSTDLAPAGLNLGLRIQDWVSPGEQGRADVVVLDLAGQPLPASGVRVVAKRRVEYSHRRRVVGGLYAYDNRSEFEDLGVVCEGLTDQRGVFACPLARNTQPGAIYLLAESTDSQGNVARAGGSYWISGPGDAWFAAGNQDRIDVIPERKQYAAGQTARLQVQTPFREATALVTVEADGVLESFVQPLTRARPVVLLPIKGEWGPNAFVSVFVVRGRVQPLKWYSFFQWGWREPKAWFDEWWNPPQPTALVDLAKPAYRIGLTEIDVGTEAFRLQVALKSDQDHYAPRGEAKLELQVSRSDGKPLPADAEVALAVVDEALLELRPNNSWDLLESMLQRRALQVHTATAQSQVIGKRHFGRKAVPAGGGGGKAQTRELFDTLLVWQPRLKLDAQGRAQLRVPLNDSLTAFRAVAVADAGTGLFGTGSTRFVSRQDLQIISGLPPEVREGDRYSAQFTLRNGTPKPMKVRLEGTAGATTLDKRELELPAEGVQSVEWSLTAPDRAGPLSWELSAQEMGGVAASDRLRLTQQVRPAVPTQPLQATLLRLSPGEVPPPVRLPAEALPGRGGLEVQLAPGLALTPPGLRQFFLTYPYSCLEQQTSRAVGLADSADWQRIAEMLPTYLDSDGLARYFPGDGPGSPVLTAYLLEITAAAGFELPAAARTRMLEGLTAYVEGRLQRQEWAPRQDSVARRLGAMAALARYNALPPKAVTTLDLQLDELPLSALIDWNLLLRRTPALPQRLEALAMADQALRNRLEYRGGRLEFAREAADHWWWLMVSGDSNAFRLIDGLLEVPEWQTDLPALLQGAMLRQKRGHWGTTTANAWARAALGRFAARFETTPVAGQTRAQLGDGAAQTVDWSAGQKPAALSLPMPAGRSEAPLQLSHQGSGEPWAMLQLSAAIPVNKPQAFGLHLRREVTPLQQAVPGRVSRGDLWRVRLILQADQPLTWVALSDPIPAGARILGDGDGRDSAIATQGEARRGGWPLFIERSFSAWRGYYDYLPKGETRIEYTLRLNQAGRFSLPGSRAEAMYAPEIFAALPDGSLEVGAE